MEGTWFMKKKLTTYFKSFVFISQILSRELLVSARKCHSDGNSRGRHNASTISATAENKYWHETAKLHSVCSIKGNYETIWKAFDLKNEQ